MELSKEQRSGSLQVSDAFHVVCPECDKVNRIPQARPLQSAKCGACRAKLFQGKPIELTGERHTTYRTDRITRCRGLLGGLVRTLPNDGSGVRAGSAGTRAEGPVRQDRRRCRTWARRSVRRSGHSGAVRVPEGPSRGPACGSDGLSFSPPLGGTGIPLGSNSESDLGSPRMPIAGKRSKPGMEARPGTSNDGLLTAA